MKKTIIYLSTLLLAVIGMASCSEDYAQPPVIEPEGGLGDGSSANPYSALQILDGTKANDVWVTGYIVGWINTAGDNFKFNAETATFTAPATLNSNILLAASPDEKDFTKCIPVQLSGDVRNALNLKDNPGNLGKQVTVKGNVEKYFGQDASLKNLTAYNWGDKGTGDTPEPPAGGSGNGSADTPFSVAQMLGGQTGTGVWISGYIVGYIKSNPDGASTLNEQWAAFTADGAQASNLMLADSPTETDYKKCTAINLPTGNVRTALNLKDNPGNLGKQVSLKGDISKYFGVNGLRNTSAYAWGPKGDGGGSNPPSGDAIFEASFANSDLCGFTLDQGNLPEGLNFVWAGTATYGLKASAFYNNTRFVTDAWAISPVIDLNGYKDVKLSFSQAGNYYNDLATMKSMAKICVREEGGEWKSIDAPTWPTGASWDFVSTGDISLADFQGKKIQIGFNYLSSSTIAGTWEIKDLKITGSK